MGCGTSKPGMSGHDAGTTSSSSSGSRHAGSPEEKRRTKAIDRELRAERDRMRTEVKLLLLGAGESGKSTIVKQMRLIYRDTYTASERSSFREVIYQNALQSMTAVLRGLDTVRLTCPPELAPEVEFLLECDSDSSLPRGVRLCDEMGRMNERYVKAIVRLWAADEIREVVQTKASEIQLNDSAEYFFNHIARIGSLNYVPSDQDILRTRVRSTGIMEERFKIQGYQIRIFDVGGQRSERKKWIHCFENVHVLIFVAAVSEYDQVLWEDSSVNRLQECLMLFENIANSRWFETSAFVLLLNKTDLFASKITSGHSPLSRAFPQYPSSSDGDIAQAQKFVADLFAGLCLARKAGPPYVHFSCATDTEQVRVVMAAVLDTVLTSLLTEVGLL